MEQAKAELSWWKKLGRNRKQSVRQVIELLSKRCLPPIAVIWDIREHHNEADVIKRLREMKYFVEKSYVDASSHLAGDLKMELEAKWCITRGVIVVLKRISDDYSKIHTTAPFPAGPLDIMRQIHGLLWGFWKHILSVSRLSHVEESLRDDLLHMSAACARVFRKFGFYEFSGLHTSIVSDIKQMKDKDLKLDFLAAAEEDVEYCWALFYDHKNYDRVIDVMEHLLPSDFKLSSEFDTIQRDHMVQLIARSLQRVPKTLMPGIRLKTLVNKCTKIFSPDEIRPLAHYFLEEPVFNLDHAKLCARCLMRCITPQTRCIDLIRQFIIRCEGLVGKDSTTLLLLQQSNAVSNLFAKSLGFELIDPDTSEGPGEYASYMRPLSRTSSTSTFRRPQSSLLASSPHSMMSTPAPSRSRPSTAMSGSFALSTPLTYQSPVQLIRSRPRSAGPTMGVRRAITPVPSSPAPLFADVRTPPRPSSSMSMTKTLTKALFSPAAARDGSTGASVLPMSPEELALMEDAVMRCSLIFPNSFPHILEMWENTAN